MPSTPPSNEFHPTSHGHLRVPFELGTCYEFSSPRPEGYAQGTPTTSHEFRGRKESP